MHEFWTTTQLVEAVSLEAKSRSAKKVLEVNLVIGKMTFLRADQMKFAYDVLTKNTVLEGSKLNIEESDPDVECEKCGYRGPLDVEEDPAYHFNIPSLSCPKCSTAARIIGGRECTIRSVAIQK